MEHETGLKIKISAGL